jgi:hypothetical protein
MPAKYEKTEPSFEIPEEASWGSNDGNNPFILQSQQQQQSPPQLNLKADKGIITYDHSSDPATAESGTVNDPEQESQLTDLAQQIQAALKSIATPTPYKVGSTAASSAPSSDFEIFYRELFRRNNDQVRLGNHPPDLKNYSTKLRPDDDGAVETEGVAKIYDLQKAKEELAALMAGDDEGGDQDSKGDKKQRTIEKRNNEKRADDKPHGSSNDNSKIEQTESAIGGSSKVGVDDDASSSFKKELDWKSKLMGNICDVNPGSSLCLTYKSLCMLMGED